MPTDGRPVIDDVGEQQERDAAHCIDESPGCTGDGGLARHQHGREQEPSSSDATPASTDSSAVLASPLRSSERSPQTMPEVVDHAAAPELACPALDPALQRDQREDDRGIERHRHRSGGRGS